MIDFNLIPSAKTYYTQHLAIKGNKIQALVNCCFHQDKSPSLSINLDTGRFNCLGCGASGGDVLDFHKLKYGLSATDAAKDLGAWYDPKGETQEALAERQAKIKQAQQQRKIALMQAAKAELAHAQAFIPLVADIKRICQQPMFQTPYEFAKGLDSRLSSVAATDIQRFTLPVDPSDPKKRPVTVCYGFTGVLTVAVLETLDGEPVALQVFDSVLNDKGKYSRWLIGRPTVLGAYYRLGDFVSPSVVLITEGVADAISCHESTGHPVIAAISKGQLLNAAKAVRAKYPHALIGFCGDNDADGGGEDAAIAAAKEVNGFVVIPKGFEGVKDFNDLHQQHGTQAVKQMIDTALADFETAQNEKAVPPDTESTAQNTQHSEPSIDDGLSVKKQSFAYGGGFFEASLKGVFYIDDEKKYHFVCSPLWVKAKTRTGQGEAWGRLLEWLDDDNNLHQWAMPLELLEGDCAEVRRELAHKGVSIEPSKRGRDHLAIYLKKAPVEARALCVERLGWYDDVYILPKQVIGKSEEIIVFQNPHGIENPFLQSGTVEQWRDNVARFAIENSRFLLALSFAFGAPLFELSNAEGGGIHFLGGSSIGKSTFLDAACSTWGKPKNYKREWRNTANAIEGLCALHNNGLLVLDEIHLADAKTVGQTTYMIVNGQSKGRMSKNGSIRPISRWNTPFLSGGEKTLEGYLKESGQTINAGQAVRLANVKAEVCKGSAFEVLHGIESGDIFSNLIKANASKYYGTVGIAWLEYVAANKKSVASALNTGIKAWLHKNVPKSASGQVSRVASRFALVAIAGEIATKQGLTGWPIGEANDAAVICFNDWLLSFGGISNHEDRAILAHVKAFFEAHGSSRFEALEQMSGDKIEKVINRVGFWEQDNTGKRYLVFIESFKNEVCKGYDHKQVVRILSESDILIKDKDGKNTIPRRTPESPKLTRMYVINAEMLFSEGTGCTTCTDTDFKEDFSCTPSKSESVQGVQTPHTNQTPDKQTDTCTPLYTCESEKCTDKKPNKINDCTPCTPCTPQKHDNTKNKDNFGFDFGDDSEVF